MKKFYRHMDLRVDIQANNEEEAEQIYQDMNIDVTYKVSDVSSDMKDPRIINSEIVDWDDIMEDI